MATFKLNLIFSLMLCLLAAACRPATPPPTTTPPAATPTPPRPVRLQPGDGTDLIDRLLANGVIRVGIRVWPEAEFAPPAFRGFSNAAIGGALNGFEVDVARQIADGLGLELELVEAYPPVIATGDWRGEWDIAIASLPPLDKPPANAVVPMFYSEPYAYIPTAIVAPAASPIQSVKQLAGRRVGAFEHTTYQRMLTPAETAPTVKGQSLGAALPDNARLIVLSNVQKAIRQMGQAEKATGPQVDAILGPAPLFQQAITENKLPLKLFRDDKTLPPHPLAIAAVPQNGLKVERLLAEINTVLNRLRRQGTLSEIYIRWYGQDFSQMPHPAATPTPKK